MTEEIVAVPALFKVFDADGVRVPVVRDPLSDVFVDFTDTSHSNVFEAVRDGLANCMGYNQVNAWGRRLPLRFLGRHASAIREELTDYGVTDADVGELFALFEAYASKRREQLDSNLARGVTEFEDLQFLLEKNSAVIATLDGQPLGGYVEQTAIRATYMGTYLEVQVRLIHGLNGALEEGIFTTYVAAFHGFVETNKLPVRFITDEERAELAERGRAFQKYGVGVTYAHYVGQVVRSSYFGAKSYRSDGRVMIDGANFRQIDDNQHRQEAEAAQISDTRSRRLGSTASAARAIVLRDEDLWRCFPFVYGFSFSSKQWGRMAVSAISDVRWRPDAWDKLVLDSELKELVRALVDYSDGSFEDIVEGKGGGTIFLFHGPPGQGKTLTAETIAELLQRPLYSVSVGELGVEPDTLEKRLRVILDVATIWNAVILIDEADIFLEERDEHNIVRNAMVGVFLRLLEYHQGVLFLTTNRVKRIDEAFYSRISIAIHFKDEGAPKREKVWTNLLSAAQVEGLDPHELAAHALNGRQIKTAIRLSQTLARSRSEPVNPATVERVVELSNKFLEEVKRARGLAE